MLYAELHDTDLPRKLSALAPERGFCLCVDIVGSTGLKARGLPTWVPRTLEAFACVQSCFYAKFPPLKSIGDALMFFVPENALRGETAATLLDACCAMASERDINTATRIAGVLCEEAYPISFTPGRPDYHGSDIDIAFRLLELAGPREVIVDQRFHDAARPESATGVPPHFHGPWPVTLRGIPGQHEVYKFVAP